MDYDKEGDAQSAEEPNVGDLPPAVVQAEPAIAPIQAVESKAGRRRSFTRWLSDLLKGRR
jgi:hypothetical protein